MTKPNVYIYICLYTIQFVLTSPIFQLIPIIPIKFPTWSISKIPQFWKITKNVPPLCNPNFCNTFLSEWHGMSWTLCQTLCIKMHVRSVLIFAPCTLRYVIQIIQKLLVVIRSAVNGVEIEIRSRRFLFGGCQLCFKNLESVSALWSICQSILICHGLYIIHLRMKPDHTQLPVTARRCCSTFWIGTG